MLRTAAAAFRLRHRTPSLGGGVRRLCSNPNPDGYFRSETEARELFEKWCKEYGKTYSSEEKKLFRFGVFRENLELCDRKNQKIDSPLYRQFVTNRNFDQTIEEFRELQGGWNHFMFRSWPRSDY